MSPVAQGRVEPLISVVIPTRDRRSRLSLALRSVLAQRGVDLEVVVVDDGSRDNTDQMVSRWGDPRVRLARNESPKGESGARNRGVAEARGVWVAFLDDDDLWAPDKLRLQLQALLETRREWAYAGDVVVDSQLRILDGSPPPLPDGVMNALRRHNSVPAGASNVIVSSKLLSRVGPFDSELRRTADWDMWLRLADAGPPACVRAPLVANCIHGGNMYRDMPVMFQELDILADRYGIAVDRARHYRWAAWEALLEGQRRQALLYYGGAIAAGDLWSVGRAAVAMVRPARQRTRPDLTAAWLAEARQWVDALAQCADEVPNSFLASRLPASRGAAP